MSTSPKPDPQPPARTPLHDLHLELGARMVDFAGYRLPVQYPDGIIQEHLHTRAAAGLFDVSHMGQVRITGKGAGRALERLAPMDICTLDVGRMSYGVFTDDDGGILDDFIVANTGGDLSLVVNAACKDEDIHRLRAALGGICGVEALTERALLALQGPAACRVLALMAPELVHLPFMHTTDVDLDGTACRVSRSGYTGEDGFELSVAADHAVALARKLLADDAVAPVGLGARDSLRLEAGLCLYGHDLGTETTPVEAGLAWTIPAPRRAGGARAGGFPGEARIFEQLRDGPRRRLMGLKPRGRAPVRAGVELEDAAGNRVGTVTSGGFGPSVGAPVAMAYLRGEHRKPGSVVQAVVRGRSLPAEVVRLPFVERRYYRG